MSLRAITLAGFKSFVEPTTIEVRGNLNAIVGPNGCGKSNVVDAIRWVIGESSAKQLRSQSMADVIFNGTNKRPAASRARVELHFDNSARSFSGPFSDFDEIHIAREVEIDGQSRYMINQRVCRRKDILELFSGTGMGSRSYSVIEQGMIARLIEAKPQDLRGYLEEACQISHYKEKRRETENRMRHCEENLERVNDLCGELGMQFRKLQRQAKNAERYQILSERETELKQQVMSLKWQQLEEKKQHLSALTNEQAAELQQHKQHHQELETAHEQALSQQVEFNEQQHEQQRIVYEYQNTVNNAAQQIQHYKDTVQRKQQQLAQASESFERIDALLKQYQQQYETLESDIAQSVPAQEETKLHLSQLTQALAEKKQAMNQATQAWNDFNQDQSELQNKLRLQTQQLTHLQHLYDQAKNAYEQLERERSEMDVDSLQQRFEQAQNDWEQAEQQHQAVDKDVQATASQWQQLNQQQQQEQQTLSELRNQLGQLEGRYASLKALQEAALHDDTQAVKTWLQQQGLNENMRLAQALNVDPEWEYAAEVVLQQAMTAVCMQPDAWQAALDNQLVQGNLTLLAVKKTSAHANQVKAKSLADVVDSVYALPIDLSKIYLAENEVQAKQLAKQCNEDESVILPDGRRFGSNWLSLCASQEDDVRVGSLQRERELTDLQATIEAASQQVDAQQLQLSNAQHELLQCEAQRETLRSSHQQCSQQLTQCSTVKSQTSAQLDSATQRLAQINERLTELNNKMQTRQQELEQGRALQQNYEQQIQSEDAQQQIEQRKQQASITYQQTHDEYTKSQSLLQQVSIEARHKQDQLRVVAEMVAKNQEDMDRVVVTKQTLLAESDDQVDVDALMLQQQTAMQERESAQTTLADTIEQLKHLGQQIAELASTKHEKANQLEELAQTLEQQRLDLQSCKVKQLAALENVHQHQLDLKKALTVNDITQEKQPDAQEVASHDGSQSNTSDDLSTQDDLLMDEGEDEDATMYAEPEPMDEQVCKQLLLQWLQELPEDLDLHECDQELASITRKISRLGAINLAAISECHEVQTRKEHLEEQEYDLRKSLKTLTDVIAEIDEQCRTKMQETFEAVNANFQEIFPSVFGGGRAELQLIEDDVLNAGVLVRAQPPGKRNTTIHVLSGGEKALTAIALVFALFKLNPAPFCILDEVDAPLDDVNVERYCHLIDKMSTETQFLVISHNKVTIAKADYLIGVTMAEPGVSRIVSVDMAQAVEMAG